MRSFSISFGGILSGALLMVVPPVPGTTLPGGLNPAEIGRVVGVMSTGTASRLVRSAEVYPLFPGMKLGVEIVFFPTEDVGFLGARNGSLPSLQPMPRLFLAKGVLPFLEISANFFPAAVPSLPSTVGGTVKWDLLNEREHYVEASAYGGYTVAEAYEGDFKGSAYELGVLVSRDFVAMKPFLGIGGVFGTGTVHPRLAQTQKVEGTSLNMRAFMGAEFDMPLNISCQLELTNLAPNSVSLSSAVFLGKRF